MPNRSFLVADGSLHQRGGLRQFEHDILEALALSGGEVYEDKLLFFLTRYFGSERAGVLRAQMADDLAFFREMDPASTSYSEAQILSIRRGMAAIAAHRIFHEVLAVSPELLYQMEVIAKYVQMDTNVEIHPAATIDVPFAIDHGHGTVIGATTILGKRAFIYHGVTLGASGHRSRSDRRHPRVGNNVFFGNGSQLLGPSVFEDDIKVAAASIIIDSYLHSGCRVFLRVRVTGVVVPPKTRIMSACVENPRRYWATLDGQTQPRWVEFDKFEPKDHD